MVMPEVTLRWVSESEKDIFTKHFQDYLSELSVLNGARPNRHGLFEYSQYDRCWRDDQYMPAFIECDGRRAGLIILRELPRHASPCGRPAFQVAEICTFRSHRRRGIAKETMRIAARMARERGMPLTWSAYMNNGPANALYRSVLEEFGAKRGAWVTDRSHGIDSSGLARFYYHIIPVAVAEKKSL